MAKEQEAANVITIPPLIYIVPIVVGISLHQLQPLPILSQPKVGNIIGWLLLIGGGLISLWAAKTFRSQGTHVDVKKPTEKIVINGPFKLSRNPMYVALNIAYLGIALIANTIWLLIFWPVAFAVMHSGVILREERYLEKKFGDEYRKYKSKVRRYL